MSWTYSGDPSTSDKDWVRFQVGDVDINDQLVDDSEIEAVLDVYGNKTLASSVVAESISAMFSRLADKSLGDYSESLSQLSENYHRLAISLRNQLRQNQALSAVPFAGGISKTQKLKTQADTDRVKPSFRRKLFENPRTIKPDEGVK